MDKAKLIDALCDIERKGLKLENKSFFCGVHNDDKNSKIMREADKAFTDAIYNLRKEILSEGV